MLEELAGDDRVEAGVLERERLLHVGLERLDPERGRLLERGGVDVEPDHRVALEEVPGQRTRAAAEVEHPLPRPDRGDEERDALGHEDEVAVVAPLAMVLLVALAEKSRGADCGLVTERLDGLAQAVLEGDLRRPAEDLRRARDVRLAHLGVVDGQRLVHDLARRTGEPR